MKYSYTINISTLDEQGLTTRPYRTLTGTVEAERYSSACVQAWQRIHAECEKIRRETGQQTAAGQLNVTAES